MANSLNKVTLIGFVGKDPEIRVIPSTSKEVASFAVATSDSWKDKATNEFKSKTEWHNIVVWNEHLISLIKKTVKKGVRVYVEGELNYRKWQDKNTNANHISAEIVVQSFSGSVIPLTPNEKREGGFPGSQSEGADDYATDGNVNKSYAMEDGVDDIPF